MLTVSRAFLIRLKLHEEPAYRIAQRAGVNPSVLSKLIRGIEPIRPGDERVRRVAKVLGLGEDEAFELRDGNNT